MEQPVKTKSVSSTSSVSITDVLFRTLHNWPWVIISVAVCMAVGSIYLLRTPKMYTRTASILVKDDNAKGNSVGAENFDEFGLFKNTTNIQNEIVTLSSSSLMEEVVKRLNLDVNYTSEGAFHNNVVYGYGLPVKVSFVNFPDNSYASFKLSLKKGGQYTISDIVNTYGEEVDNIYTARVGDTITTALGTLAVVPTPYYSAESTADLTVAKTPVDAAVGVYRYNLVVSHDNDQSSLIVLTFTDESIPRADDILSTLIEVYNENWIREKNQVAVSTSDFINERLGVIEGELGNVDSDISSFKSSHMIPDVDAVSSLYMNESQRASQELLDLNNQLQLTRYIRSLINSDSNRNQVLPSVGSVSNADVQGQLAEYNNLVLRRNNLVSKSSDKNPLVVTIDEQIAALRGAMLGTIDNYIVALNTKIRSLQGAQANANSKIASGPSQAKYLLSVERQQKVKESLYLFLLQKREENELSQAFTAYNTRVVERPGGSGIPTSPNGNKILMASFMIGLAIPFALFYLLEMSNTRLRGRKDIEDLAAPFLGEIPAHHEADAVENARKSYLGRRVKNFKRKLTALLPAKAKKDSHDSQPDVKELVVKSGKRDIINEAFRVLRTNVEFMRNNKDSANVIAITSFNPGSGKSFISMNLGTSLSLKNRRVLVVDGDMRHGSASKYVGSPKEGLANYLADRSSNLSSLIVPVGGYANLSVLPIGIIPPNPTELLESSRFGEMLTSLRRDYDYIIIDCPPIEVVADAQIIDQYVDRTVFIVRAGLLERSMLPELDRLYKEKKYRDMAVILNGTANETGRLGYSHSYRYGYGYGYGYGYNYSKSVNA